jgi:hypothetical protein
MQCLSFSSNLMGLQNTDLVSVFGGRESLVFLRV